MMEGPTLTYFSTFLLKSTVNPHLNPMFFFSFDELAPKLFLHYSIMFFCLLNAWTLFSIGLDYLSPFSEKFLCIMVL